MDDALVPYWKSARNWGKKLVLILVLMDDALVRENKEARKTIKKGLNPCFNG